VVVVVDVDELAQTEVAGQGRRLVADALLETTVTADDEREVITGLRAELGTQEALGDAHADPVGEALAERPGRHLDAGGVAALGVSRGLRVELAEGLEVVEGEPVAGQ